MQERTIARTETTWGTIAIILGLGPRLGRRFPMPIDEQIETVAAMVTGDYL